MMAELTLVEEIQLLINLGVDPTVAATTVNNERARRSPPAAQPGNYLILLSDFHRIFYVSVFYLRLMNLFD